MTEHRLLPIAEVARLLNLPESTLHYWKNRFSEYLPSVGDGRQRRYRPEVVEIFKAIAEMLKQGLSTQDIKAELGRSYPLNIDARRQDAPVACQAGAPAASGDVIEVQAKLTAQIGMEIARAIGETLKAYLPQPQPSGDLPALAARVEEAGKLVAAQTEDVQRLQSENDDLRSRLHVMEAELVRLRKDRRELEKYLVEKIKASRQA